MSELEQRIKLSPSTLRMAVTQYKTCVISLTNCIYRRYRMEVNFNLSYADRL